MVPQYRPTVLSWGTGMVRPYFIMYHEEKLLK